MQTALIAGIDEAGRGPVIGPMVMCGFLIDEKDERKLVELGVKDSKLLTPAKRDELFDKIKGIAKAFDVQIHTPLDIDAVLKDDSTNLNLLEADTSAEIINILKPARAILDCPSPNLEEYAARVKEKLNVDCELVAEHKADLNHPVVGAASIIAKVTRDREIEKIKDQYGDVGSGYPSDPVTKRFLDENYKKHPEIFRQTWESYKAVIVRKEQKRLGEF